MEVILRAKTESVDVREGSGDAVRSKEFPRLDKFSQAT